MRPATWVSAHPLAERASIANGGVAAGRSGALTGS